MESQTAALTDEGGSTIGGLLGRCARRLMAAGIPEGARDAEVLLACALGLSREELLVRARETVNDREQAACEDVLQRRLEREPVAYITGSREFWSLDFAITPDVLIPRPETELLVEIALEQMRHLGVSREPTLRIADIGTGSGAIATALAAELPRARLVATDISQRALALARLNAERHQVSERIRFVASDLFGSLAQSTRFDLILSNPPYIRRQEIALLQPEVSRWEPRAALDGGDDGLAFYRRLAREAPAHLAAAGSLLLEIGARTGDAVSRIFQEAGWSGVSIHKDYAGCERVVVARNPGGRG